LCPSIGSKSEKLYHFGRKDAFFNLLYSAGPPGLFQSALYKTRPDVDIIIESLYKKDSTKIMSFQAAGNVLDQFPFGVPRHESLSKNYRPSRNSG
jgi:hypothetical protein